MNSISSGTALGKRGRKEGYDLHEGIKEEFGVGYLLTFSKQEDM